MNPAAHSEVLRGEISEKMLGWSQLARVEDVRIVVRVVLNARRAMGEADAHSR